MTVELLVVGPEHFVIVCDADWADELAPWRTTGDADCTVHVDLLTREARSHGPLPDKLSPEILQLLLAGIANDGFRSVAKTGRAVLSMERFRDGVVRNHARYVADIFAGLIVAALP